MQQYYTQCFKCNGGTNNPNGPCTCALRTDPVIEAVRKDLHDRSQIGIKKYGTTLSENICSRRAKLQHAYEEALDLANYLKWSIMEIDAQTTFTEEELELGKQVAAALKAK